MRCEKCNGAKVFAALGGIEKKCPECNGIGYVKKDSDKIVKQQESVKIDRRKKEYRDNIKA